MEIAIGILCLILILVIITTGLTWTTAPDTRPLLCRCVCHDGITGIHTTGQRCECGELSGQLRNEEW